MSMETFLWLAFLAAPIVLVGLLFSASRHTDLALKIAFVIGCRYPARAGTEDGLDRRFCRKHYEHHQRHGSTHKASYSAKHLAPHRKLAIEWLSANSDDPYVKNAIERVRGLYQRAAPVVEAFRLRGLPPQERARAAWARLRRVEVDPRRPVAVWLAIELAIAQDPQPDSSPEYKRVQAAKLVHRMASVRTSDGNSLTRTVELHVYPRRRGRVLRHIGEDLEGAVELLLERRLRDGVLG